MENGEGDLPLTAVCKARAASCTLWTIGSAVWLMWGATLLHAQEPPPTLQDIALDSVARRVRSITPAYGPIGTSVTIESGRLPAITPLRIGIGATHFGFEEIGQVMTDVQGELTATVIVPAWAQRDATYRFIVFDFYFRPIALSDAFHVTGPNGTLIRRGTIVDREGECPVLHGDDEVLYSLLGPLGDVAVGDTVTVEASIAEPSTCVQGTTLQIIRVQRPMSNIQYPLQY